MRNCNNIKDLLLTDYFDAEVDSATKEQIHAHLKSCADCQLFAREVETKLAAPLNSVPREVVPAQLWSSVKQRIQEEPLVHSRVETFLKEWFQSLMIPRLAPAVGVLTLILLLSVTMFNNHQKMQVKKEKEQIEYLASLLKLEEFSQDSQNNVQESPIEEFFL